MIDETIQEELSDQVSGLAGVLMLAPRYPSSEGLRFVSLVVRSGDLADAIISTPAFVGESCFGLAAAAATLAVEGDSTVGFFSDDEDPDDLAIWVISRIRVRVEELYPLFETGEPLELVAQVGLLSQYVRDRPETLRDQAVDIAALAIVFSVVC